MKETVEQLKQLLGDDFEKLVTAFDEDNRKLLDAIDGFIHSDDAEAVARQLHSLKGASANIGASELSETCQQLEQEARSGDLSNAKQLLTDIRAQFEAAVHILRSA